MQESSGYIYIYMKCMSWAYFSLSTLAADWQPPGTDDCMFTAIFELWMLCRRCIHPYFPCSLSETLALKNCQNEQMSEPKINHPKANE